MKYLCMQLDILCTDHVLLGLVTFAFLHTTSYRDMFLHPKLTT